MINTVIFDIGKVLISFDWDKYVNRLFDSNTAEKVTDAMWNHGYWNELDRGVWSEEEVLKAFVSVHPECESEIREAYARIDECALKQDYAIEWVKSLRKQGYRVLFLSNYFEPLMKKCPDILDFIPYMDGGVFSWMINLTKPDKAIYEHICSKYNLVPGECLFIDDNRNNVDSANEFGINAILFENYEKTYPVICEYLEKNGQNAKQKSLI